jgi:glycosyltransferase involved in cell wall biosynthesis
MRILFISNLYPPYFLGGYELGCHAVAESMKARGHEVRVLTSTYGVSGPESDGEIYRWLIADGARGTQPLAGYAAGLLRKETRNQRAFRRLVESFKPDLVYLWNLTDISISPALWAQRRGIPTSYYVFDLWLASWRNDRWLALWPRESARPAVRLAARALRSALAAAGILSAGALDLRGAQFASHFLKRAVLAAGEQVGDAQVIHWGIEMDEFPYKSHDAQPHRLLLVGQLGAHKGVHTAVEALRILVRDQSRSSLRLTLVGSSSSAEYESQLRGMVREWGLAENVEFAGFVPHERLPEVFRAHDVLLFPSVCDEGLGITILEAMASGLPVLGTASGGSAEILKHEETGLVFPKEDARTCAAQLARLLDDQELFERLRRNARLLVEENFRIERLMDRIERALHSRLAAS